MTLVSVYFNSLALYEINIAYKSHLVMIGICHLQTIHSY